MEEIEAHLGCDWLIYQDLEDMEAAVSEGNPALRSFDSSCFNGHYPTGIEPGYFERIQQLRSDDASTSAAPEDQAWWMCPTLVATCCALRSSAWLKPIRCARSH